MRYLIGFLLLVNLVFFFTYPSVDSQTVHNAGLPPLPGNISPLVLLDERRQRVKEIADGQAVVLINAKSELPAAKIRKPACFTIGPFLNLEEMKSARAMLRKQDYSPRVRTGQMEELTDYWIYIPSMPASRARAIVADLDRQGMKDYYVSKKHVISLGVFTDQDKAAARQQLISSMGYDTRLYQRYITRQNYWLNIETSAQPLPATTVWRQLQIANPDITAQKVSCE